MKTILIVDDDLAVRELMADMLTFWGYRCSIAADGLEALEAIAQNRFDLVITDLDMPRMNGIELIKAIRQKDSMFPVIAMSGNETAGKAIADRFIPKPFNIDELRRAIEAALLPE